MGAVTKIILGLIVIVIGLGLFADSPGVMPGLIPNDVAVVGDTDLGNIDWLGNFVVLLTGFIPPFLIVMGLFVVWLEIDELKMQRELERETEKKEKKEVKEKVQGKKKKSKKSKKR